ncbi:MAG: hypothetical protein ABR985_03320 [Methanotrichaceae archaeon]|jgi:Flp pilus assembly protein TadD
MRSPPARTWYNKGIALKAARRTTEADVAYAKPKSLEYLAPTS